MHQNKLLVYSYIGSTLTSIVGAYIKIMRLPGAEFLLAISFLFLVIFIVTGFKEVWYSNRIPESEKTMWLIGFFFLSWITGLIYFWLGRKRVVG
ncbi:MAG: hypothetical protein B7Y15_14555 [Bacteroidetes bacterium 24-39-8]|jgi:uncharacterized membrane protein|nr:MAG: hypothetical protein B7Y15_14555 [Bacteroidetes bacterium 24-39-8]OZA67557.1 MAG: hypothetical protein B7X72_03535 [Sphingobacteriia bacterium 39-39-8]HQR91690.1 hypothetical protein [Sediminibacterium sp.]HQS56532.1 hypothetical protein [Sediminibacterium sp.]